MIPCGSYPRIGLPPAHFRVVPKLPDTDRVDKIIMEPQPHDDGSSAYLSRGLRANRVCDQFEAACKAGTHPRIDEFLTGIPRDEWPELLRELLILDIHYRRQLGESPTPDGYRAEYPTLELDPFADLFVERTQASPSSPAGATVQVTPSDAQVPSGELPRIRYLGDYELVAEIARGGMGVVYKARQISLNRIVAVKMILAGILATKADHDRFHSEAQAAALLDHPNIVPIFEVGEHEGQHYFSMGYVDGQSLAARLAEGPLPPKEAAELVATVAEAVEYAHRQGVIHRDIKPSNILIDNKGRPRITDFGLAKRVGSGSDLTAAGQVLGTPSYMPPEQAAGQINIVGPAADVYSLGALLYAMLASRPPFQAATPQETLRQVIQSEPVALRQLNPGVPRDLETIALKCLEKPIPRRYATAQALAEDLRRYLEGRPILARPVGQLEHAWRWCRRQPVVASLIAATTFALVAGIVVSCYFGVLATQNAIDADKNAKGWQNAAESEAVQKGIAEDRNKKLTELNDDLRRANYAADVNLASRAWDDDNAMQTQELLDRHVPKAGESDLRGFEWYYLRRQVHSERLAIKAHGSYVESLAYMPDGKKLISIGLDSNYSTSISFTTYRSETKLWDAETGAELPLVLKGPIDKSIRFDLSADGKLLAGGGRDKLVRIWNLETGEVETLAGHTYDWCQMVVLSADRRYVASIGNSISSSPNRITGGSELLVWDRVQHKLIMQQKFPIAARRAVFSPDGKRVAVAVYPGNTDTLFPSRVQIWDVASGNEVPLPQNFAGKYLSLAFSPNGACLAVACEREITLFDSRTLKVIRSWVPRYFGRRRSLAFSPDGKRIATTFTLRGVVEIWDPETGTLLRTLKGHLLGVIEVAFSPDNRHLASSDLWGNIKIWDTLGDRDTIQIPASPEPFERVEISRDGRIAVTGLLTKTISLWDTATGNPLGKPLTLEHKAVNWDFTADGRRLVITDDAKNVTIWDVESRKVLHHFNVDCPSASPNTELSGDGKWFAIAGPGDTLKVWDVEKGEIFRAFQLNPDFTHRSAFSPDGRLLAVCDSDPSGDADSYLKIWDFATRELKVMLLRKGYYFGSPRFSADGQWVAWEAEALHGAGSNVPGGELQIVDVRTREVLQTLRGSSKDFPCIAFSPDRSRLAAGSMDGTVTVFNTNDGHEVLKLNAGKAAIGSLTFNLDGRRLIAICTDLTVRVFDATPVTK